MNIGRMLPPSRRSDVEIKDVKNRNIFHSSLSMDTRGGIDIKFLVYTVTALIFGAVMNYSASSVYAEQMYGDSTYFLIR